MILALKKKRSFGCRFSARYREYKYFLPAKGLDVDRMRAAAAHFLGEHDFRNFCKADVVAVQNFVRKVLDIRINEAAQDGLLVLYVKGTAFLWHQVRCMVAILMLVGSGREDPSVVSAMLDLSRTPRKPQYSMASEMPLLLFDCGYQGITFRRSTLNHAHLMDNLSRSLSQ